MICLLGECPHDLKACKSLGVCGAERALKLSGFGDGYEIASMINNRTIQGLVDAGLVRVDNRYGRLFVVRNGNEIRS